MPAAAFLLPLFGEASHERLHDGNVVAFLEHERLAVSDAPRVRELGVENLARPLVAVADAHPLITPRVCNHLAKAFGADAQAIESWRKHWTSEGLATYERLLTRRAPAPFALGEEPCVADICIAGQVIAAQFFKIGLAEFPLVGELAERCFALPAFATSHPHEQPGYKAKQG